MASYEVVSHWYQLISGLNHSSLQFYNTLAAGVGEAEIPKAKTATVEHKEGGLLSAKRAYYRVRRKDLNFDICAAPFGDGFFVSWWLVRKLGILASLATIPILGWIVRAFISPITYYQIDTALMFQSAVRAIVLQAVDELTSEQGLRALSEDERKPIMRDLFARG